MTIVLFIKIICSFKKVRIEIQGQNQRKALEDVGPGVSRNKILSLKSLKITLPPKSWVASNANCFEISKMCSAVFVT